MILLFSSQAVINGKLCDRIANIILQANNHLHWTANTMGQIFHVNISKCLQQLLFCLMKRIMEFEITKELIIGFTGIANLQNPSKVSKEGIDGYSLLNPRI